MNFALLSLDERPASTRYPAQIAAIAWGALHLPPATVLSTRRYAADRLVLAHWLTKIAPQTAGIAASVDLIGYGGTV